MGCFQRPVFPVRVMNECYRERESGYHVKGRLIRVSGPVGGTKEVSRNAVRKAHAGALPTRQAFAQSNECMSSARTSSAEMMSWCGVAFAPDLHIPLRHTGLLYVYYTL